MFFDPLYFVFIAPAVLLMLWAQSRISTTYQRGMEIPAPLSGAAAAQHILDSEGIDDVVIEQTPGHLSDHYDPSTRTLRLSPEVFSSRTATAVGIAAHEVGHAIQHARSYAPLVIRNAAVPAAQFGGTAFSILLLIGFLMQSMNLILLGVAAYAIVVVFQLVNLPVEFNASSRAKRHLNELGIVSQDGAAAVSSVLNAAAWTYVAGTLQSVLVLAYYAFRIFGGSRDE